MKRNLAFKIGMIAIMVTAAVVGVAQSSGTDEDDNKKKKVKKKIEVVEENGETKVTVETEVDGKVTKEVYEGEEAEEYLKNMDHGDHRPEGEEMAKTIMIKIDSDSADFDFDFDFSDMEELKKHMDGMSEEIKKMIKMEVRVEGDTTIINSGKEGTKEKVIIIK